MEEDGYKQTTWSVKTENFNCYQKIICPLKVLEDYCVLLSLKPMEHEYKIMGLAPYSKNNYANDVLRFLKIYVKLINLILWKKLTQKYK